MEVKSLKCPNCGASINYIEDELDMFYCKYCKYKIILEGQSDAAYESKSKIKKMKHDETMRDKSHEHEKFKMNREDKNKKMTAIGFLSFLGIIFIIMFLGNQSVEKQEIKLQNIVDEIMIDIENEDFDEAYIKANTLYWDSEWTSEGEEKWEATREATIEKIEEAEKAADKKDGNNSFFDWFD